MDSLCIIQDSREDWDVESGFMHLVYRNAVLTISIARSSNPHTGYFISRYASMIRPFSLDLPLPMPGAESTADGNADGAGVGEHSGNERHAFWKLSWLLNPDGPLHNRAWVLQEQAFSGRTVSFSDAGVFWSCASVDQSEFEPHKTEGGRRDLFHQFQKQIIEWEGKPEIRARGWARVPPSAL